MAKGGGNKLVIKGGPGGEKKPLGGVKTRKGRAASKGMGKK